MIEDFRSLQDGQEISCDLCIIGGGAAGVTIALQFAGTSKSVCLLESGGLDFEPDTQDLYAGEVVGVEARDTDVTRLRYLGGTTNHWGGRCAPLNEIDLVRRPWIKHSGWPITLADIDPYYPRANELCGMRDNVYGEALLKRLGLIPPAIDETKLRNQTWQFRASRARGRVPLRFGEEYRDQLESAENIRVLLYANATNIQTDETGSVVEHVEIASLEGQSSRIVARQVVLACGGIENARTLLFSNKVAPNGLGNDHDLVGRFFADHPAAFAGTVVAKTSVPLQDAYNLHVNRQYLLGVGLSPDIQKQREVANCAAILHYTPDPDSGILALRRLWTDLNPRGLPEFTRSNYLDNRTNRDLASDVWRVITDLDDTVPWALRRFTNGTAPRVEARLIEVEILSEQTPNPESRVTLGADLDALGLNRVRLDWRLTDQDRRTAEVMLTTLAEELGRLNLGRVHMEEWISTLESWSVNVTDTNHHLGTTRMSDDPTQGVVDRNCRIHGVDNLYVAGSSVFTCGGHANPTLTLVALALRLAEHLDVRLSEQARKSRPPSTTDSENAG